MDLNTKILGIAFLLNTGLGVSTFIYTERTSTHKYYLWLIFSVSVWILTNLLVPFAYSYEIGFVIAAFGYISALSIAYSFFNFCNYFPNQVISARRNKVFKLFWIIFIILSVATFIPGIVIKNITLIPWNITPGLSVILIFLYFLILLSSSFLILLKALRNPIIQKTERIQTWLVFIGYLLAALFGIIFNLVLPFLYQNYDFVRVGPVFVLVAIVFISYAIVKHHLFSIKVIAAELLTFGILVAVITQAVMADTISGRILGGATAVFAVIAGIFLIKSVKKEVAQREEIEQLATRLKSVNRIMSHDIKNVLGKNKDMFGMLLDGSFGLIPEPAKPFLERLLCDTKQLVRSVISILESGQEFTPKLALLDLKVPVLAIINDVKHDAEEKGLTVNTEIDETQEYTIMGDEAQLSTRVFRNLIENAIHYTLAGSVTVGLSKKDANTVIFSVADTGIGISEEDQKNLFKEGAHGKDSIKVNVHSTGFGLFSAKKIVDVHKGNIYFKTEAGKGTTFWVELETRG